MDSISDPFIRDIFAATDDSTKSDERNGESGWPEFPDPRMRNPPRSS